jgi:hypothetical protein
MFCSSFYYTGICQGGHQEMRQKSIPPIFHFPLSLYIAYSVAEYGQTRFYFLLGLTMGSRLPTGVAELTQFHALGIVLLVFRGGIIAAFAGCASQCYHNATFFALTCHLLLRLDVNLWLAAY